jgi:hypothetical protein
VAECAEERGDVGLVERSLLANFVRRGRGSGARRRSLMLFQAAAMDPEGRSRDLDRALGHPNQVGARPGPDHATAC